MLCSKCGKSLPDDVQFCMYCGQPLTAAAPTTALPTNQPSTSLPTLEKARRMLRQREISSGRELLRHLSRSQPNDFQTRVETAFEFLRPPEDPKEVLEQMQGAEVIAPGSSEVQSLIAIGIFRKNYIGAWHAYSAACTNQMHSSLGAVLLQFAGVCMSDLIIQASHARTGTRLGDIVWIEPLNGIVHLLNRQHDEAFQAFRRGLNTVEEVPLKYESFLNIRLSSQQRTDMASNIRGNCVTGHGLTLLDVGRYGEAREAWRLIGEAMPAKAMLAEIVSLYAGSLGSQAE